MPISLNQRHQPAAAGDVEEEEEDLLDKAGRAAEQLRGVRGRLGHRPDLQRRLDALVGVLESRLFARAASVHGALEQLQELQRRGRLEPDDFGIDPAGGHLWLSERGNDLLEDSRLVGGGGGSRDGADDALDSAAPPAPGPASVSELKPLAEPELLAWLATAAGGRRVLVAELVKRPGQPLGFSVVGFMRESGDWGIFVQGVQPDSPADREGHLEERDQLLAINGVPLDGRLKSALVVELLQSVSDRVRLHLCRHRVASGELPPESAAQQQQQQPRQAQQEHQKQSSSSSTSAAAATSAAVSNSFDFEEKMLNTEWTELEVIDLASDGSGLGFGIIGSKSAGVVVRTILPGGVADADGRLRSGDHLLCIGQVGVRGMTSEQVATVLRQSGDRVRLVVARALRDPEGWSEAELDGRCCQLVPTAELDGHLDNLVATLDALDDARVTMLMSQEVVAEAPSHVLHLPGVTAPPPIIEPAKSPMVTAAAATAADADHEEFFVDLQRGSGGLGITIAGYVGETSYAKLNGIFIKEIADGSAAARDGRLKINDRIVQVDSVSLDGYTNQEAVEILKRTGSTVSLKLIRYRRGPIYQQLLVNTTAPPPTLHKAVVARRSSTASSTSSGSASDVASDDADVVAAAAAAAEDEVKKLAIVDKMDDDFAAPLSTASVESLKARWRRELGQPLAEDCEIVVAQFAKFPGSPGLGFSLEGTVDVLEDGAEARPRHYIRDVLPDGPAGLEGSLRRRDELLEVNGRELLGLDHLEVVAALKSLPDRVRIVCARRREPDEDSQEEEDEADEVAAASVEKLEQQQQRAKSRSADDFSSSSSASASVGGGGGGVGEGGMGVWSDQPTVVELEKSSQGLGFSVLDYQDPLCADRTVIIVRSLVPDGLAHRDGRVLPGDRLLFVNDVSLERASLEEAVQCLKAAPAGRIVIGVAKPCPLAAGAEALRALKSYLPVPPPHMAQPSGSSHKRQASDLSLDTGTFADSADDVSLSSFVSSKTDADEAAETPDEAAARGGVNVDGDGDAENGEGEGDDELPPIPSALERTLKLRKAGYEELGLVVAAAGNGANGCLVTEVLPGSAAHRSGAIQQGDYVTGVNSEPLRRVSAADARAALRRASLAESDISLNYIPAADAEVHLQSVQFARQEAKKFAAANQKQQHRKSTASDKSNH